MKKFVVVCEFFAFLMCDVVAVWAASAQDQKAFTSQLLNTTAQSYLQTQQQAASGPDPGLSPSVPSVLTTNQAALPGYTSPEQNALNAVWQTKDQATDVVKSLGGAFQQYFTDKNVQLKQRQMLDQFDNAFYALIRGFPLNPEETKALKMRVEKSYVDDVTSGRNELDQQAFRDLSYVIRKEYSEMMLAKAQNGMVDVYDFEGRVKTRWNIVNGKPHGFVVTYYESGQIFYVDTYEQGWKVRRKKYTPEGRLEFDEDYRAAFQPMEPVKIIQTPVMATAPVAATPVLAESEQLRNTNESCPCKQGAQPPLPAVTGNVVGGASSALPDTQPRST